jgi:Uncharacterised nucleotidyltransferase
MTSSRLALEIVRDGLRPMAGGAHGAARRRELGDWTRPLALANAHYLGPALYASLRDGAAVSDLPQDVADYLALLHRLNGERNEARRRQAIELLGAFAADGIRALLLKGG